MSKNENGIPFEDIKVSSEKAFAIIYPDAIAELKRMHLEDSKAKYPNLPEHARPAGKYSAKDTNGLTNCVISWLNFRPDCFAFRINSQGQYDQKLKRYRKGGTRKGLPDIVASIRGQFYGIEVKFGRDKVSEDQVKILKETQNGGGRFLIVRDFQQFVNLMHDRFEGFYAHKIQWPAEVTKDGRYYFDDPKDPKFAPGKQGKEDRKFCGSGESIDTDICHITDDATGDSVPDVTFSAVLELDGDAMQAAITMLGKRKEGLKGK